MIDILEDKNILTEDEKEIITNEVLGDRVAWVRGFGTSPRYPCYMHVLAARNPLDEEVIVSPWFDFFRVILDRFVDKHNLAPNGYKVLRSALNDQIHYTDKHGDIHLDYLKPNYLIILYLNDNDKGGTNVYDKVFEDINVPDNYYGNQNSVCLLNDDLEDGKIWDLPLKAHIKNEKFKISLYNGKYWHAACPGKLGQRRTICMFSIQPKEVI